MGLSKFEQDKLLKEAKSRYPPGTKVISLKGTKGTVGELDTWLWDYKELLVDNTAGTSSRLAIYKEEEGWAEITESPTKSISMKHPFKVGDSISNYRDVLKDEVSDCYRNEEKTLYERRYTNLTKSAKEIGSIDDTFIILKGYFFAGSFKISEILKPNWEEIRDISSSDSYSFTSTLSIPSNLGKIEFLRSHPAILKKLIERSRDKRLEPFIEDYAAGSGNGGFGWASTPEGGPFWNKILSERKPEHFYTIYPRESLFGHDTTTMKPFEKGDKVKLINKTIGASFDHPTVQRNVKNYPYGVIQYVNSSGTYDVYTDGPNRRDSAEFRHSDLLPYYEDASGSMSSSSSSSSPKFKSGDIVRFKNPGTGGSHWFKKGYENLIVDKYDDSETLIVYECDRSNRWWVRADEFELQPTSYKSKEDQELEAALQEAKRRFPIGTTFVSIDSFAGQTFTVERELIIQGDVGSQGISHMGIGWVWYKGQWAVPKEAFTSTAKSVSSDKWFLKVDERSIKYVNAFRESLGKDELGAVKGGWTAHYEYINEYGSGHNTLDGVGKVISLEYFIENIWTGPKLSIPEKSSQYGFRMGDIVTIKKSSTYYTTSESNPRDITGKITNADDGSDDHPIRVLWSNGRSNSYRPKDLEFASDRSDIRSSEPVWQQMDPSMQMQWVPPDPYDLVSPKKQTVEVPLIEVKQRKII